MKASEILVRANVSSASKIHIELTDNNGCQNFDPIFIQVNEITVDLGNDTLICNYDAISFNVSQPLMTYLWQDGTTTPTYTTQTVGDFHVTLTDTIGCQGSDTLTITYAPTVDLGDDRLFKCDSSEMTIIPNLTTGTFLWQDGIAPFNANYGEPDPDCDVNLVLEKPQSGHIRAALSNSLGFGGSNSSLVFRNPKEVSS